MIRIFLVCIIITIISCNPYKGFKGVDDKGMSKGKLPSQELRDDYDKGSKRMKRSYKRKMRKRAKRLGTTKDR